jgi:hypothetical protein
MERLLKYNKHAHTSTYYQREAELNRMSPYYYINLYTFPNQYRNDHADNKY